MRVVACKVREEGKLQRERLEVIKYGICVVVWAIWDIQIMLVLSLGPGFSQRVSCNRAKQDDTSDERGEHGDSGFSRNWEKKQYDSIDKRDEHGNTDSNQCPLPFYTLRLIPRIAIVGI